MAIYQSQFKGTEIDEKLAAVDDCARVDGSYETLGAGTAEQLNSSVVINNKVPYNFRTSGGSIDIGNRKTEKLVGGTIVWNQLWNETKIPNDSKIYSSNSYTENNVTFTKNGDGTISIQTTAAGASAETNVKIGSNNSLAILQNHKHLIQGVKGGSASTYCINYLSVRNVYAAGGIYNKTTSGFNMWLKVFSGAIITTPVKITPQIFDLTQMFGSAIADHLYALETATAGAGVALFKSLFPKPYYSNNAGQLLSVKTSKAISVGFNAYDNSTGKAKVVGGNVYQITGAYTALSLDGETITPDSNGKFTPSESGELTVTGGNATNTCVHLVWDGERDGEYEPYKTYEYALDSDLELRGVPKLDANDNIYYDGDTYDSDGIVTRKYGIRSYTAGDESDSTVVTDGTNTVYALATPTTEAADPYLNPMIVDDFGTEEFVDERDVAVPVGHDTDYMANLRAKLEMSPNSPDGDGDYIVRQTDGVNSYVPLVIPAELPTAPTTDGTYKLTVTVADGVATYQWVAN